MYTNSIKKAIQVERDAISELLEHYSDQYDQICQLMMECKGKIVFIGVGKSGHIGKKLAATFSSTGTPSFFVHATEAVHGDLGMIESKDIAVLISNSGNTSEIINTIPTLQRIGCKRIAFTSGKESELAKQCAYQIFYPKLSEADHLKLAPTTSSTLTLVVGDAIACALSEAKSFENKDFLLYHPAGSLGKKLKEEVKES